MDKLLDVFDLYLDADSNKVDNFMDKISSQMKVVIETNKPKNQSVWIDKMEDTLVYLENILRTPTRLIINEE